MTKVSVVMPVRNVAATVKSAATSVLKSPEVAELLVYDSGSSDDTLAVLGSIDDPRLQVFDNDERGLKYPLTMNFLFDCAAAPYVALCDGDDLYVEDRLKRQVAFLEAHPDHAAISTAYRTMTAQTRPVANLADTGEPRDVTDTLRSGRPVTHLATFLVRNDAMRATGYFRNWFENAFDLDLQFRLADVGPVWHDPTIIGLRYRLHDASMTHNLSNARRQFFDRCATEFALQRRESGADDLMRGTPPDAPPAGEGAAPFDVRDQIAGQIESEAWRALESGRRGDAVLGMMRCLRWKPASPRIWRSMATMLVKVALPRP